MLLEVNLCNPLFTIIVNGVVELLALPVDLGCVDRLWRQLQRFSLEQQTADTGRGGGRDDTFIQNAVTIHIHRLEHHWRHVLSVSHETRKPTKRAKERTFSLIIERAHSQCRDTKQNFLKINYL